MATPSDAAGDERLHPTSLFFSIGPAARALLLPGLFVLIAARGSFWQYPLMLLFIPAVASALARYWSYRYRLEPDELVIREGIVTRNERHVPYSRIQNIDLRQNPLHRLLRVTEVRVETAGGEKPEAVMRVLSLEAVERMRSRVFRGRLATAPGAGDPGVRSGAELAESAIVHRLTPGDVVLFGVISNKGMVVVAALLGALWQFDLFDRLGAWITPQQFQRLQRIRAPHGIGSAALLVAGALVLLVVVMRLLSVAWALLRFHDFRLERRGEDLRVEHGLLTRVSTTIPRHRVQVLLCRAGPLHRLCDRSSLQVQTAGGGAEGEGGTGRAWLAPVARAADVARLVREVLPDLPLDGLAWQPVSPRARRRILRISLVTLGAALAGASATFGVGALLAAPPLLVLAWLNAKLYVRHAAYALAPGAVVQRSGWWVRSLRVARFAKIQSVEQTESPFDRRQRMAAVRVDTAGARQLGGLAVSFLDAEVAARLRSRLADEAARTSFRW